MNLSHLTLRRLVQDLQPLKGARIQDAALTQPNTLILDVARSADAPITRILISGSRSQARICITETPFPQKPDRPPWLDRYLSKAVIRDIRLQPDDRVITFELDKQDRVGSRYPSTLVAEMISQDSNAIVIDDSGRIQGLLRPQNSANRKLRQGGHYAPVPPQDRRIPSDISPDEFSSVVDQQDDPEDALLTSVSGMSRPLAREIIHRSEGGSLLESVQQFYAEPPFSEPPGCLLSTDGRKRAVVPFSPRHLAPDQFAPAETISDAIEQAFEDQLKGQEEKGQKKDLQRTLKRATKQARTKRDRIAGDLVSARDADILEQKGSLILSNTHQIEPGTSSIELENLFAEDHQQIEIELNPNQTAAENGEAYLKRAAKARKSVPVLERRLKQTEDSIFELEQLTSDLAKIEAEDAVEAFRKKLEDRGLIRPRRLKQRPGKPDPSGLHPRRYRTSDGWEVWVGRNDNENDRITKTAPKTAIWLHAHGCPGSHVVLRPRDQREPSQEALYDAASLAAYWSKARGAKTVPVNYTEARYVQKPKGAPAGLVTIRNEKTLFVQPREIEKWEESG